MQLARCARRIYKGNFNNLNINLDSRRLIIRNYIKKNKGCTYKQIKNDTKLKVERLYKDMKEAYIDAKVDFSKNLLKRNKEEQINSVIEFIKSNPKSTVIEINNILNVNIFRTFRTIIKAYKLANINYPIRDKRNNITNLYIIKRAKQFENKVFRVLNQYGQVIKKVRLDSGVVDCLFKYNA